MLAAAVEAAVVAARAVAWAAANMHSVGKVDKCRLALAVMEVAT